MSKTRNTSPTIRVLYILRTSLYLALFCFIPCFSYAQTSIQSSIGLVGVNPASTQGCAYMNRIYVFQVVNSGSLTENDLRIDLPFANQNQLGSAFIEIVEVLYLDGISSVSTNLNLNYDGANDVVILDQLSLDPGQQISIQIELEMNPSDFALLSNSGIQGFVFKEDSNGSDVLVDASDGGFIYHFDSFVQAGDTGGSDDPLVFDISYLTSQILTLNNNLNISLGQSCSLDLNIDMLAENPSSGSTESELPLGGYYDYQLFNSSNQTIAFDELNNYLGESILIQITHIVSCSSYWTQITISDNLPPVFENSYSSDTVSCFMDFNTLPPPIAFDNCGAVSYHLIQQDFIDNNICDDETELVRRYWISRDESLNESATVVQDIFIVRDYQIDFPNDVIIECSEYLESESVIEANNNQAGIPVSMQGEDLGICNYSYVYSDQLIPTCANSFQIFRTWTVLDWCTGNVILSNNLGEDNIQIIEVVDTQAPEMVIPTFTLSATEAGLTSGFDCYSIGFIPAPFVSDECNSFETFIITPVGEAIYLNGVDAAGGALIPEPGLSLGSHEIVFQALDFCGNVSEKTYIVNVVDDITPTMICDELTQVAINNLGIAEVAAINFDDGSFDNCCADLFTASRDNGLTFAESVIFDCADVGDTLDVVLRLSDCFSNSNQCNVQVLVEDKIEPVAFAPVDQDVGCQLYYESILPALEFGDYSILEQFGSVQYYDNCNSLVSETVNWSVNSCGQGVINRSWIITDEYGNSSNTVIQQINVESESIWSVDFPEDSFFECTSGIDLSQSGQPVINNESCHQMGISHLDEVYEFQGGACKTILRHWSVINWCTFPEEPAVEHTQLIEITDEVAPEFNVFNQVYYVEPNSCDVFVELAVSDIEDCSDSISITFNSLFENQTYWMPGNYTVAAQVMDWCNNQSTKFFEVSVIDTIAPVPFAQDQFTVDLGGSASIEISADQFNIASFDNCSSVHYSFSSDPADSIYIADCEKLGLNELEFWVIDLYGNASFVTVQLDVTDNMGLCGNTLDLIGQITMPNQIPLSSAELLDQTDQLLDVSASDGSFDTQIDLNTSSSLSVVIPYDNISNGVTTFDLVKISKHILNIQVFDNPYQYWAADVNGSKTVTTLDMVFIQKVILGMNDGFPMQKNWLSFFDTGSEEIWTQQEDINCESVEEGEELVIIAVKLGDVNFNAIPE